MRLAFISLFLLGLGTACTVTETGNPELSLRAHSTDPEVATTDARRSAHQPLQVDEAWVSIGDIRFVQGEVCDAPGETEYDAPGPHVVDLLGTPEVVQFEAARDDYCRVRVPFERADAGDGPAGLEDAAIVIRGVTAAGTPFTVVSGFSGEVDVRSRSTPFSLDEAKPQLVLGFDLATWLGDLALDTADRTGGEIQVDDDTNRDLLDAFEARVEAATELFDDRDGDHELGEDEAGEPLASGG